MQEILRKNEFKLENSLQFSKFKVLVFSPCQPRALEYLSNLSN